MSLSDSNRVALNANSREVLSGEAEANDRQRISGESVE
jgi:hypothetical protein